MPYRIVPNLMLYQLGWLACVLGAAWGLPWLGTLLAVPLLLLHFRHCDPAAEAEVRLLVMVLLVGASFESLMLYGGWLRYNGGTFVEGVAPHWILALWLLFATTLNHSLRWLRPRLWLASMAGAIFGPLAWYAGNRFGAVEFSDTTTALLALAIGWALMLPLFALAAQRLHAIPEQPATH